MISSRTNGTMREEISNRLAAVSVRDLMLVTAVNRCGGFRAAAEEMGISPSGLSHQVRKVEQALDVVLFERGTRSVAPTDPGKALLSRIDEFLRQMVDLSREADQRAVHFGGNLRLGVISTVGPYVVPEMVEVIQNAYPSVTLELMEGKHEGLSRRLLSSEIDLLITAGPLPHAEAATHKLHVEDFVLLARSDHDVSQFDVIDLHRLSSLPVLPLGQDDFPSVPFHGGIMPSGEGQAQKTGAWVRKSMGLSVQTRARLVQEQNILCLVPLLAAKELASKNGTKLVALSGNIKRTISAHWRQRSPYSYQLGNLARQLEQLFERL